VSKGWPLVSMEDIFAIARGGSPRPIDSFLTDDPDGVNWVMISDATESGKYINSTKKRIREEGVKRSRVVQPGDFLLTNSMSFGRPYIMNISGCIHDGWLVLSPRHQNVSPDFFYHLLGSDFVYAEFVRRAAGATVKNLNIDLVKGVQVPLPPMEEQRRIAEVLDRAEALRTKRRATLSQLDTLTQSIFLDLLREAGQSVATVSIEDGMEAIIDYRGKSPAKTAVGVPLVTARVVKGGELLEPNEFIAEEDYDAWMRRGLPNTGDVLFTTEAPLGEVAQLDGRKVALAQRLLVLRGKPSLLDNTFLKHALTAQEVKKQINARATGSTVRGIRQRELRKVMIPVPPLPIQRDFARRVAAVEKLKAAHRVSLAELNALFAMLQDRAFRGEL
jgi:type I restriction enzyme, S subunit